MPVTIDGRYWNELIWSSLSSGDSGFGPLVFGPVPSPFEATQTTCSRCGVAAANTGYDAVGMRPTREKGLAALRRLPRVRARRPSQPPRRPWASFETGAAVPSRVMAAPYGYLPVFT